MPPWTLTLRVWGALCRTREKNEQAVGLPARSVADSLEKKGHPPLLTSHSVAEKGGEDKQRGAFNHV
jgi:hypothetical protein